MADPDLPDIHDGDLAYAWNVQNIEDILKGRRAYPIHLTKHSDIAVPTLTLQNLAGSTSPILLIYQEDGTTEVMRVTRAGIVTSKIAGWFDFAYQAAAPSAPGTGTQIIRMYARAGQLYFKVEGGVEQQIPTGLPPGPTMRYGFWMGD